MAVRWHDRDMESKIRPRQTLSSSIWKVTPKAKHWGSSSNFLKRFSCARRKSTSCYNLVYVCPFCPGQSYEIGAIGLIINYIYLFGTLRNIRIGTCALVSFRIPAWPQLYLSTYTKFRAHVKILTLGQNILGGNYQNL